MPSQRFHNLARALLCAGLLASSACVRSAPPSPAAGAQDRAAALERELAETRRQLALQSMGLERASVSRAALERRIEELKQLNAEIASRLETSAHGVELLAAERKRLAAVVQCMEPPVEQPQLASTPEAGHDPYAEAPIETPIESSVWASAEVSGETNEELATASEAPTEELATLEP
jgi:hypothetical protein